MSVLSDGEGKMNKRVKKPDSWFVKKLIKLDACPAAIEYARRHKTFEAAWNSTRRVDWLHWLCTALWLMPAHTGGMLSCAGCRWQRLHNTSGKVRKEILVSRVVKALRKVTA